MTDKLYKQNMLKKEQDMLRKKQNKNLAKLLKTHRLKLRYSQDIVANEINVNRATYSYYESGAISPDFRTMSILLKVLEIPTEEFLKAVNIKQ